MPGMNAKKYYDGCCNLETLDRQIEDAKKTRYEMDTATKIRSPKITEFV